MKRKFLISSLCALFAMSLAFSINAYKNVNAEDVSENLSDTTWEECAMVGGQAESEIIKKASDSDGGDVILRNFLTADGTAFEKASNATMICNNQTYTVNGFEMKFYLSASTDSYFFKIIFSKTASLGLLQDYKAFGLQFNTTGQKVTPYYDNINSNLTDGGEKGCVLYTDYDYFADKASGFSGVNVGTLNTLSIQSSDGVLSLFINCKYITGLPKIQSDIVPELTGGAYFQIWNQVASSFAMRITEINENESSYQSGMPNGYMSVNDKDLEDQVEYSYDKIGNTVFRNLVGADYDYFFQKNSAVYFSNLSFDFLTKASFGAGDVYRLHFDQSTHGFVMEFSEFGFNTAKLKIYYKENNTVAEWQLLSTSDVPFFTNGKDHNIIKIKEIVSFDIIVNDTRLNADFSKLFEFKNYLKQLAESDGEEPDYKACIQFESIGSSIVETTLYNITSSSVSGNLGSVDGYSVSESTIIKNFDGDTLFYTDNPDGNFKIRYTAAQMLSDAFQMTYKLGKYAANNGTFTIALTNNKSGFYTDGDIALLFSVKNNNGKAELTFAVSDKGTITPISTSEIDIDWDYSGDEHTIGFADNNGYYIVFFDYVMVGMVGENQTVASAIAAFENKMATLEIDSVGDVKTAFSMSSYQYYVAKGASVNWQTGPTAVAPEYGYSADGTSVIGFTKSGALGISAVKTTKVLVNGFKIELKTYKTDGNEPTMLIFTKNTDFYTLTTNGLAFQIQIYEKPYDAGKAVICLRYTDFANNNTFNQYINEYVVDWNWNNNVKNTLEIVKEDGSWLLKTNGTDVSLGKAQSTVNTAINKVVAATECNGAVLQLLDGFNMSYDIISITDYVPNASPKVTGAFDASAVYTAGNDIKLDLSTVFSDADGDTLNYVLDDSVGAIELGVWKFTPSAAGDYKVTVSCFDGKGGSADYTFTVTVSEAQKEGCKSDLSSGFALCLFAAAFIFKKRKI